MNQPSKWDSTRPFITALVILAILIALTGIIYSLKIDVAIKSSLIGVVIGGGLSFLGQMWAQDVNNTQQRRMTDADHKQQRDIAAIDHQHQQRMAEVEHTNTLQMAALEKRLQAHQEAFALWRELYFSANPRTETERDALIALVIKSYTWWANNCLYLTQEASDAFSEAAAAARDHNEYFATSDISHEQMRELSVLRKENWARLTRAGQIIANGVGLPDIKITLERNNEGA